MNRIFFIYLFLFSVFASAQDTLTLKDEVKIITADPFENIYVVGQSNNITKYNIHLKEEAVINLNYLGEIASIDVSNPFEIYVFLKENNKMIFLNSQLGLIGETQFYESFALLACRSFDNNIWIYNINQNQLIKVNKNLNPLSLSENLQIHVSSFQPFFIKEYKNLIYLQDSVNNKILVFDINANLIGINEINHNAPMVLTNDSLLIINDSTATTYSLNLKLKLNSKPINPSHNKQIRTKNHIVHWNEKKIYTSKIRSN